jgi:hypothetical protein
MDSMRPRTWFEAWLMIAAIPGLAFAVGWIAFTDTSKSDSALIGLAFGALIGLIGASRYAEVRHVGPVSNAQTFLAAAHERLVENGFAKSAETATFRLYQTESQGTFGISGVNIPGFRRRARIKIENGSATIVASRDIVTALQPLLG